MKTSIWLPSKLAQLWLKSISTSKQEGRALHTLLKPVRAQWLQRKCVAYSKTGNTAGLQLRRVDSDTTLISKKHMLRKFVYGVPKIPLTKWKRHNTWVELPCILFLFLCIAFFLLPFKRMLSYTYDSFPYVSCLTLDVATADIFAD